MMLKMSLLLKMPKFLLMTIPIISYITNAADTNPANAVKSDDHTDAKATAAVKGHPGSMQFQENIPIITYTQLGLSSVLDI